MAMNFIKDVYNNQVNELAHAKFVRYGKGNYEKEEMKIKVGSKIQIWAGFEYVDVFFRLLADVANEDVSIKGIIVSKTDIREDLVGAGIEPKKVTGKKYTIEEELSPARFKDFVDKFGGYYLLLAAKSGVNEIKTKKSVPKPGKLIEKFATVKFDKKHLDIIKDEFLFDYSGNFKEASITHTYNIQEIVVDDALIEKDPAAARLAAKRKGTLIRKRIVDGKEEVVEKDFMA
jgi:hypothetical protein